MKSKKQLLERLSQIEKLGQSIHSEDHSDIVTNFAKYKRFDVSVQSFLEFVFGTKNNIYSKKINRYNFRKSDIDETLEILKSLREEIDQGFIGDLRGWLSVEIFTDFLEMAEHLLEEGYKDASAVINGSVLERHLRGLCEKGELTIQHKGKPKNADRLTDELYKAGIISKLDNKNIKGWLQLRNYAAHGNYDNYSLEQVKIMVAGVSEFSGRQF